MCLSTHLLLKTEYKHIDEIKALEDDSDDIFTTGLLKMYSKIPLKLENVTSADWAAWYDSCSSGNSYVRASNKVDIDGLPLEMSACNENDDEYPTSDQKCMTKGCKKRSKARIIRSVFFNKHADPEKHYRKLIMLFTPWRNDEADLLGKLFLIL